METQPKPAIPNLNRQHRDSMFRGLFIIPQNTIQLLNHCSGGVSTLTAEDITPFDLESAIAARNRRNDISFLTKDNRLIILVEHQSTICPNMALRLFLYYVELLQLWIKLNKISLYASKKIADLPAPEFYVAYNGSKKLTVPYSTFITEHTGIKIDIKVKIVDIHYESLADTATGNALAGYSYFYKVYDECIQKGIPPDDAFTTARNKCMKRGYLTGFIEKEDFIVLYKEILNYDEQLKAEGRAEGIAKGKAEGKVEGKVEGKAEGKVEGKAEGLLEAAISLVKKGTDIEYVIEAIPLSDSQISQLKKMTA